jgi:hypothetical protein
MRHVIRMAEAFGTHLADGDRGAKFRFCEIEPLLSNGHTITFDFTGVTNMTDSFANACFGVLAQGHPNELGKRIIFRNTSPLVQDFLIAAISQGLAKPRTFA